MTAPAGRARRLTLLRHAKAVPHDDALPDRDRPLNERGEHDARLMGRRLRQEGARPSLVLTSPAVRALETARLVAREIGYPLEFLQREAGLYLATPQDILRVLGHQDTAFNDIVVCGHNPGLTDLANRLTGAGIDNIPTCGLVVIEAPVDDWWQMAKGGRLLNFESPRSEQRQDHRH